MSLNGKAYVVGAYEHPTRRADGISLAQLHADVALGALADAGLGVQDVDGYFCANEAPGIGILAMSNYLGLRPRYVESTETGGSSYIVLLHHAALAIAAGRCNVALITMGDTLVAEGAAGVGLGGVDFRGDPESLYAGAYRTPPLGGYAMVARRHMHDFGTTAEQLAWVRVAASHHAQHNPHALLRQVVSVEDVLASPFVADPLRRLDCCVLTDGGGAIVLARPEIARGLARPLVKVAGVAEAVKNNVGGRVDLTTSAGAQSAPRAFEEAGCRPQDIRYASLYDSFTITVVVQLEDVGFCPKGQGGRFAADGNLISGVGKLPFNTDGGGLCSNHPGNRGGMTKILEAVRQSRGEAHPAVQVPNPDLVLAHGTGGSLAGDHAAATLILERE
ncbi:MAG TPA: thiolase domain-containing protein [Phenylobacterium sp.]|nr:thiolase domain-containing protein [Phenylobacterium sp.]